jgi:hypothetical protein
MVPAMLIQAAAGPAGRRPTSGDHSGTPCFTEYVRREDQASPGRGMDDQCTAPRQKMTTPRRPGTGTGTSDRGMQIGKKERIPHPHFARLVAHKPLGRAAPNLSSCKTTSPFQNRRGLVALHTPTYRGRPRSDGAGSVRMAFENPGCDAAMLRSL